MTAGTRYTTADFQAVTGCIWQWCRGGGGSESCAVASDSSEKTFSMLDFRLLHDPVMTSNYNILDHSVTAGKMCCIHQSVYINMGPWMNVLMLNQFGAGVEVEVHWGGAANTHLKECVYLKITAQQQTEHYFQFKPNPVDRKAIRQVRVGSRSTFYLISTDCDQMITSVFAQFRGDTPGENF